MYLTLGESGKQDTLTGSASTTQTVTGLKLKLNARQTKELQNDKTYYRH